MNRIKKKKGVVCAFGTFDFLHPGHLFYLHTARMLGTSLVVIVTPDSAALRRSAKKTILSQDDRADMVRALKGVDDVVLGDEDDSWDILKKIRPDIIVFGYDQRKAMKSCKDALAVLGDVSPEVVRGGAYRARKFHSRILKVLKK